MSTIKIRDVNIHYRVLGERGPWLALITGGRRAAVCANGRRTRKPSHAPAPNSS